MLQNVYDDIACYLLINELHFVIIKNILIFTDILYNGREVLRVSRLAGWGWLLGYPAIFVLWYILEETAP